VFGVCGARDGEHVGGSVEQVCDCGLCRRQRRMPHAATRPTQPTPHTRGASRQSATTGRYDQTTTNLDTHQVRSVTHNPDQTKRSPLPDQLHRGTVTYGSVVGGG
jgi:hypothetical protein